MTKTKKSTSPHLVQNFFLDAPLNSFLQPLDLTLLRFLVTLQLATHLFDLACILFLQVKYAKVRHVELLGSRAHQCRSSR